VVKLQNKDEEHKPKEYAYEKRLVSVFGEDENYQKELRETERKRLESYLPGNGPLKDRIESAIEDWKNRKDWLEKLYKETKDKYLRQRLPGSQEDIDELGKRIDAFKSLLEKYANDNE